MLTSGKIIGFATVAFAFTIISIMMFTDQKEMYSQILGTVQTIFLTVFGAVFAGKAVKRWVDKK